MIQADFLNNSSELLLNWSLIAKKTTNRQQATHHWEKQTFENYDNSQKNCKPLEQVDVTSYIADSHCLLGLTKIITKASFAEFCIKKKPPNY